MTSPIHIEKEVLCNKPFSGIQRVGCSFNPQFSRSTGFGYYLASRVRTLFLVG